MKRYKVVFSDLAKADLQEIVNYIAVADDLSNAKHVERSILSQAKKLRIFPEGYPKDPYVSTPERIIRFAIKWRYKILFVVDDSVFEVQIIGIFHMAQDTQSMANKFLNK